MFRRLNESEPIPRTVLLIVVGLAIALRVGWSIAMPTSLEALPDQQEYVALAESVLDGRGFALTDERYAVPQTLLAQRMPGYAAFVAALGASPTLVRIAQALIEASTVLATMLLTRQLVGGRCLPILAGAGVALHPYLAYFSTLVLTETLFTALLTWAMWALVRSRDDGKWWWLAAVLMLTATYLRPSGAALWLTMALAAAVLPTRVKLPIGPMATAMAVLLVGLSPWIVRNALVLEAWVPTTTNSGITLYDGWNADNTTGGSDQAFVPLMPELSLMSEVERNNHLRDKAVEAMRRDPWRTVELAVKKVGRTWSPVPLSEPRLLVRVVGGVFVGSLFVLALIGLMRGPGGWRMKVLLLTPIVTLTLLHAASVGSMRYRLPIDPLLCVLATGGLAVLTTRSASASYESST